MIKRICVIATMVVGGISFLTLVMASIAFVSCSNNIKCFEPLEYFALDSVNRALAAYQGDIYGCQAKGDGVWYTHLFTTDKPIPNDKIACKKIDTKNQGLVLKFVQPSTPSSPKGVVLNFQDLENQTVPADAAPHSGSSCSRSTRLASKEFQCFVFNEKTGDGVLINPEYFPVSLVYSKDNAALIKKWNVYSATDGSFTFAYPPHWKLQGDHWRKQRSLSFGDSQEEHGSVSIDMEEIQPEPGESVVASIKKEVAKIKNDPYTGTTAQQVMYLGPKERSALAVSVREEFSNSSDFSSNAFHFFIPGKDRYVHIEANGDRSEVSAFIPSVLHSINYSSHYPGSNPFDE